MQMAMLEQDVKMLKEENEDLKRRNARLAKSVVIYIHYSIQQKVRIYRIITISNYRMISNIMSENMSD